MTLLSHSRATFCHYRRLYKGYRFQVESRVYGIERAIWIEIRLWRLRVDRLEVEIRLWRLRLDRLEVETRLRRFRLGVKGGLRGRKEGESDRTEASRSHRILKIGCDRLNGGWRHVHYKRNRL